MRHTKRIPGCTFIALIVALISLSPLSTAHAAGDYNDSAALKNLSVAKSVFLIDFTDAEKTDFYLKIIKGTHDSLVKQNVQPEMVLVFIGKTVDFLTTEPKDHVEMDFADELASIAQTASELKQLGVRMEVCAVATSVFGVDNETILPAMDVVGDGFISLIGWQSQGYKLVPIF